MADSQVELNKNQMKQLGRFVELLTNVVGHVRDQVNEVYREGALDSKTKRLMAMAIALGARSRNCVLGQTMFALEKGARKKEILETIGGSLLN